MAQKTKKFSVRYHIRNNDCYDPYARKDEDALHKPCVNKKEAIKFIDGLYSSDDFMKGKITQIELVTTTKETTLYYKQ